MEIKQIMVAGAGQMGSGIAQTAADADFYVRMYDVNPEAAEAGLKWLKKQLARDAEKGKRTETEVKSVISRISISQTLEEAEHADIVIEAIAENMAAKTEMFKTLDVPASYDFGQQYIFLAYYRNRCCNKPASTGYWHAFYESRPCNEAGRSDSRLGYIRRNGLRCYGISGKDGENSGRSQ